MALVGSRLAERREELVDRIVTRTKREIPAYAGVTAEELADRTAAELRVWLNALVEGRTPSPDELLPTDPLADLRAKQGVTPEAIARATQIYSEEGRSILREILAELGRPEADVAEILSAGWELGDLVAQKSADEIERVRSELVAETEGRATEFVAALIRDRLAGAELATRAAAHDLDPDLTYRGIYARPLHDDVPAAELRRTLDRTQSTLSPRVFALIDGDVAGLISEEPPEELEDACCGVGPSGPLSTAAVSLRAAARTLETAWRFRKRGVHTLEQLGPLSAVAADDEVGKLLDARFVDPLRRLAQTGDALLETVDAYLAHGMRVEETANALSLHPNSLRKRLRRFEDLTEADLRSIDDLVAVWWALRRREVKA